MISDKERKGMVGIAASAFDKFKNSDAVTNAGLEFTLKDQVLYIGAVCTAIEAMVLMGEEDDRKETVES